MNYLHTNNVLEFYNASFDNLCNQFDITRHRTVSYSPQQNGVAERINRILLDKVRCKMLSYSMPKSCLDEAIMTHAIE